MKTVNYCRHVKEDGIPCGSPPLRGENYCHFHLRYKRYPLRTWRNKNRLGGWHFTPGMALNLKAAQAALKRVERALSSGTCADPKRARLIRCALQMIVSDLRYMHAAGEMGGPASGCPGALEEP
jgi:hypothetical protein